MTGMSGGPADRYFSGLSVILVTKTAEYEMTGHLMNPVNRQYVEKANLFGQRVTIGIHGSPAGCSRLIFQGVATGIHSASGHFSVCRTQMTGTNYSRRYEAISSSGQYYE
jgi:hypothetical protein